MNNILRIENVNKSFSNQKVLKNVSINFSNKGLIAILGKSGSGKSTLLNLIAGVDNDYEGNIYFDNRLVKSFSSNEKEYYRLKNLGYVFQNFMLMDLENVFNNVYFPLNVISNTSIYEKKRRVKDLLNLVHLKHKSNQKINTLSGGEKQRVAIARSLVNNPDIILCDEPTGALDEKNSNEIMNILKTISQNTLVIVVSHDVSLVKQYADKIIHIENGEITKIEEENNLVSNNKLALFSYKVSNKKPSIPLSFIFSHIKEIISSKKIRTFITTLVTSIGLLGVGASMMLTSSISKEIKNAFSSVVDANKIVMKNKNSDKNLYGNVFSASLNEINQIRSKFPHYINDYGVNYLNNFETYFLDDNEFYISSTQFKIPISNLSARSINDYLHFEEISNKTIYPSTPIIMEDEQILLGLNTKTMFEICFSLSISRTFEALGQYILSKNLTISLYVRNSNWQYEDEQIFNVVGVFDNADNVIAHKSNVFNEITFEDHMRLPTTDNMLVRQYPWTLSKVYYVKTKNTEEFLDSILLDKNFNEYVFDRANHENYKGICKGVGECNSNRVLIYHIEKESINISSVEEIISSNNKLESYLICNDKGYSLYSNSLTMGFSDNFYISDNKETIDDLINFELKNKNKTIKMPDNAIVGSALKSALGGLTFSSNLKGAILKKGNIPKNINEIAISSNVADKLLLTVGDKLNFGTIINYNESSPIDSDYYIGDIKIVGIIKDKSPTLYHNKLWTISFFRDKLGISMFSLLPRSVLISTDKDNVNNAINYLNKNFREFSFSSPSKEIGESIDETLDYVIFILLIFSLFSLVISILLIINVTYLTISENSKDILLFRYLGISDFNIIKMFTFTSIIMGLLGYLIMVFELIMFSFVFKLVLSKIFYSSLSLSISLTPFLVTFLIVLTLSSLIGLFVSVFFVKSKKIKAYL